MTDTYYRISSIILGGALGWCFCEAYITSNKIPLTTEVQTGYIAPSELEIECKDLDGNGKPETIMKIGEESYLLKMVDGEPELLRYSIEPIRIVPE
ncbi:MAG: hypothetical protein ABIF40_00920 [archaeon]